MKAEKVQQEKVTRTIGNSHNSGGIAQFVDNRPTGLIQAIQKQSLPYEVSDGERATQEKRRIIPPELASIIPKQARSRTLEETEIDVLGTGSALNSLATAPFRTVGNFSGGLFSGFPSRAVIRNSGAVKAAMTAAWNASFVDFNERFGWIIWDQAGKTFNVPVIAVGTDTGVNPGPKPGDAYPFYCVGEFHNHPPLSPRLLAIAPATSYPIGPSPQDENAAQAANSPGIVHDFDSIARTGAHVDYTYGPWKRI